MSVKIHLSWQYTAREATVSYHPETGKWHVNVYHGDALVESEGRLMKGLEFNDLDSAVSFATNHVLSWIHRVEGVTKR